MIKRKTNFFYYSITILLSATLLSLIVLRYNKEINLAKNIETFESKIQTEYPKKLAQLKDSFAQRNLFLFSLAAKNKVISQNDYQFIVKTKSTIDGNALEKLENKLGTQIQASESQKKLFIALIKLEEISLRNQKDFAYFDTLNSYTNELIVGEILRFRSQNKVAPKASRVQNQIGLFTNESQIRSLERYDLAIDYSRKKLAELSFENNRYARLAKSFTFIKAAYSEVPYFKIDELILEASQKKQNSF